MEQALPESRFLSFEEYLRDEATSTVRHEFRNGRVVAMAGGSYLHAVICTNLTRELGNALRNKPCRPLDANLRIKSEKRGIGTYPDASVHCGQPQFALDGRDTTTLTNPRVIFEVLSPSTEDYDRGEKFEIYRSIDSFEEYVLISQTSALVQVITRQPDGKWTLTSFAGLDSIARITTLGLDLALKNLYEGVEFS